MKIGLVQMAPRLGDLKSNLARHLEYLAKARKEHVDLIVFPELSLTGYSLKDLVNEVALDPGRSSVFKEILSAGRGMSSVFGFVEERAEHKGLFYNAAAFCSDGNLLHVHRKVFLPTFGLFEEGKFFAPGRNFTPFASPYGTTGLMICRDFLQFGSSYLLFAGGADIYIVISAAPGRGLSGEDGFESSRQWELMGEAVSTFATAFVLYCNRVGSEDGVSFAGGSFAYGPKGDLLAKAPDLDEKFLIFEIDLDSIRQARLKGTFKRDDKPEVILHSLERIVRRYED